MNIHQYPTKMGKVAIDLSSEEYVELLGIIFKQVTRAVVKEGGQLLFMHDHDPAHKMTEAQRLIEGRTCC